MGNRRLLGPKLAWKILEEVEHMVRQSVKSQALELGWVRDNACEPTIMTTLRTTLKKTCWYTCIHPCRIGALIGARGEVANINRLNRFGYYMGAALPEFRDDVLNLIREEAKYGKEIGTIVLEGERTLILIHLLRQG